MQNPRIENAFLICMLILTNLLFVFGAAGADNEAPQQKELENLRKEIEKYERELSQKKAKEAAMVNLITELDREIDATTGYLRTLKKDIANREQLIKNYDKQISTTGHEVESLKDLIKRRIVSFYKHGQAREVELLLSSRSLTQVKVWMRYQKMIAENDQRNYQAIINKQKQYERQQNLLRAEITEKDHRMKQIRAEEQQLKQSRQKRSAYLSAIRNDQKVLKQHLAEVKSAEQQILAFIAKAEERRLTEMSRQTTASKAIERPPSRSHAFAALKGKLQWPTQGTIITHFGRQKHPLLNTVTENLGIEIKAKLGAPVLAVDDGQVQTITWQRGRGNIIIISHDDGYYTVYTHLAEIDIDLQQEVRRGQVIGTVGDSGSISGPILHFQIWKNTSNLNPEDWLT
jgi:septal ring factor EnvC (AmiA/AmiB activator)